MNKKMMALAVAGAFTAPATALAQVQIYGRANVGVDSYSATGATTAGNDIKARNRVYDSGSRIGFRGTEDLGGGLRAVFQIESGVNIDTGAGNTQNTAANASTATFASRDSYAGLEGSWGRVTLGRQSIYWVEGILAQSGANYINADVSTTGILGRVVGPTARTSNTVAYNSPTFNGVNFTVSYAPNSETAAAGANTGARIYGATVRYSGIVNGQVDYAVNQAASGAASGTQKLSGLKVGVGYPYMPGAQIAVVFISEKNDNLSTGTGGALSGVTGFAAAGDSVKANAIIVNWEHTFGNLQALAEVGRVGKASGCSVSASCDDTESQGYMLGGRYLFSKRTAAYVSYNKITNKANATWDVSGSGLSGTPGVGSGGALSSGAAAGTNQAGADPRIIALGIIHNF